MKKLLLFGMILLISVSFGQQWEVVKSGTQDYSPNDGPNASSFINNTTGWLVNDEGRVTKTTDGGLAWTTLREPVLNSEDWVDVEFLDASVGYACADKGKIYKTIDGGENWEMIADTNYTDDLKNLDAVNVNVVYFIGKDGCVLKTVDGGVNFTKSDSTFNGEDLDGGLAFCNENVGVVMSDGNGGPSWHTADGGVTWNFVPLSQYYPPGTSSTRMYDVGAAGENTIVATGYHYVTLLSRDGGATYSRIGGLSYGYDRNEIVDMIDENTFLIAGDYLALTTDGGETFDTLRTGSGLGYDIVDFVDKDKGFVAQDYFNWSVTENSGQTWANTFDWPAISFWSIGLPSEDKIVLTTWGGGDISESEDGGVTFSYPSNDKTNTNLTIYECEFVDENIGFIAGSYGFLAKTTDGGATYTQIENPMSLASNKHINALHVYNKDVIFAGGSSGYVMRSTDGGTTWSDTKIQSKTVYDIYAIDANTVYASQSSGIVAMGVFDGDAVVLDLLIIDVGTNAMRAVKARGDVVLIPASKGEIYRFTEGDTNFVSVFSEPDGDDFYDVEFVNDTLVYVAGENGKIYKSEDAGLTWTKEDGGTEETLQKVKYAFNKLWAVGQGGTILKLDLTPLAQEYEITFQVNMSVKIAEKVFDPENDIVDIAGTLNEWGTNTMVMDDSDDGQVYSITVPGFIKGETVEYKFRINSNWDTSEFPGGGPNRAYIVPAENSTVTHYYDDDEVIDPVGIDNRDKGLPTTFALHQNYPNPFNPITSISFDLPKVVDVKISVYNVLGQKVHEMNQTSMKAGYYKYNFDGSKLSSGIYIYNIKAGTFSQLKKMTLIK